MGGKTCQPDEDATNETEMQTDTNEGRMLDDGFDCFEEFS